MRLALKFVYWSKSGKPRKLGEAKMRALAGVILGTAIIFSAEPTWAQTHDPKYPVCMEEYSGDDTHIECSFTSMEQCKNGSSAITGRCFENPYYKPPPPEPEPVAETPPAPAAKSKKTKTKQ